MKVFIGIIFILAIIVIIALALKIGFLFLLLRWLDVDYRKKFGDNYELAVNSETAPVECAPKARAIAPEVIKERTGIAFPPFEVERCVSLLRHFTGDYVEQATLLFDNIPLELYSQIRVSRNWETTLYKNEVCYVCAYRDLKGFWNMYVLAERPEAIITYGK